LGILDKKDNGVSQLLGTKYKWAKQLHKDSVAVTWTPHDIPSGVDKQQWETIDLLSHSEKHLVKRTLGLFSAGESLVSNSASFIESQYITEGALRHYLARKTFEECLTSGHKVLTDRGWINIDTVTTDDSVYSYSIAQNKFIWSKVNRVVAYSGATIHKFSSKFGDVLSSGEHRHYFTTNQYSRYNVVQDIRTVATSKEMYESKKSGHFIHSILVKPKQKNYDLTKYTPIVAILLEGKNVNSSNYRNASYKNINLLDLIKERYPLINITGDKYTLEDDFRKSLLVDALDIIKDLAPGRLKNLLLLLELPVKNYYTVTSYTEEAVDLLMMFKFLCNLSPVIDNYTLRSSNRKSLPPKHTIYPMFENVYCISVEEGNFLAKTISDKGTSAIFLTGNSIHADTAEACCEWFSLDEDEVAAAYKNIPSIKAKEAFIMKSLSEFDTVLDIKDPANIRKFILNMFVIYMIVEGLWFIANFVAILSLKRRNLLPGLGTQILYTWRDEEHHIEYGIQVLKILREEYPEAFPLDEELYSLLDEALEIEFSYIDDLLPVALTGLSAKDLKSFAEFLANKNLLLLGYKVRFPTVENPIDWLHEVTGDQLTAFFEQREKSYKTAAVLVDDY
jgi:ribonucleotide reductase beta subunit family protein with ferritin-like domain